MSKVHLDISPGKAISFMVKVIEDKTEGGACIEGIYTSYKDNILEVQGVKYENPTVEQFSNLIKNERKNRTFSKTS